MSENFAVTAERFVEHRRALGRKYISEEHELRLLVRFAEAQGMDELDQLGDVPGFPTQMPSTELQPPPGRDSLLSGLGRHPGVAGGLAS